MTNTDPVALLIGNLENMLQLRSAGRVSDQDVVGALSSILDNYRLQTEAAARKSADSEPE